MVNLALGLLAVVSALFVATLLWWQRVGYRLMDGHARMRQALLWYADRSHWRREHPHGNRHWVNSAAAADRGARAARALDAVDRLRQPEARDEEL